MAMLVVAGSRTSGIAQNATSVATTETGAAVEFSDQPLPPLTRVVFYNSGVAHMQHAGSIQANARLNIRFSGHDVDDVLKSLVFQDDGGGHVRAVEYQPAPDAESVAANAFVPMTLAQLLQKYRGETVQVTIGDTQETGTIFGVENRAFGHETTEVLVLLNEEGTSSIRLNDIDHARFESEEVRKEMSLAMAGVAKSRKANQRQLDLLFVGEGRRDIAFAYVVDAPIWRLSYRLAIQANDKVLLQGWTHINNVTGVDWKGVAVELRSGQPQAFHAELFAPVLAERPNVGLAPFGLPQGLTLVKQWYGFEPPPRFGEETDDFGDDGAGFGGGMGGGMFGGGGMGGGMFGGGGGSAGTSRARQGIDIASGFERLATLDRTSQLVRFQLDMPVDLASGKSAALPVFSQALPARLLSVVEHQESDTALTAIRAVELTNTTQFSLVPGPVHVGRDGDFVGDAQLDYVAVNAKSHLPYAIDRPLKVDRTILPTQQVLAEIRLQGASAQTIYQHAFQVHFDIDNQDIDQRLLLLHYELPRIDSASRGGDDVFDSSSNPSPFVVAPKVSPKPNHIDAQRLSFEVPATGLARQRFTVSVSWQETRIVSLDKATEQQLQSWLSGKVNMSDVMRAKLTSLLELRRQHHANSQLLQQLLASKRAYSSEQQRIRENLQVLGIGTTAAEPFLKRLNETETDFRQVEAKLVAAQKDGESIEQRRNELLGR